MEGCASPHFKCSKRGFKKNTETLIGDPWRMGYNGQVSDSDYRKLMGWGLMQWPGATKERAVSGKLC